MSIRCRCRAKNLSRLSYAFLADPEVEPAVIVETVDAFAVAEPGGLGHAGASTFSLGLALLRVSTVGAKLLILWSFLTMFTS